MYFIFILNGYGYVKLIIPPDSVNSENTQGCV